MYAYKFWNNDCELPEGGKKSSSLPQNSLKRQFVKQYEDIAAT